MLWCRNIPNQTISGQLSDMLLLSLLFVCFWSFVCYNLYTIFLYMCGVWYAAVFFNAYLWVSFSACFFLDLDWLNTSFKCCSVCKVSEKVAKNDIAWCHILTILVEAMSPCDLLLGAVSNRCIFGGCGSQTTGGTLKGLNMRMLGKRLVEDEIDKIKPYRFKPYVWCFGVHSMYSEVYIPWIMTSCGGNGGKGDDFPRRSMVRSGELQTPEGQWSDFRRKDLSFPQWYTNTIRWQGYSDH